MTSGYVPTTYSSAYAGDSTYSASSSYSSGSGSSYSSSSSISSSASSMTKRKCAYCNGTGRVRKSISTPTFGQTETKKRCQECGEYYYPSCGHAHVSCGHCGGTGIAK